MTNQTNTLIRLFVIVCFSMASVTGLFAQVIGDEHKDIPVMTDIVTIRQVTHVTLESDNQLGDVVDDAMNQLFQVWQQSLNDRVLRDVESDEEESNIVFSSESTDDDAIVVEASPVENNRSREHDDLSLIESLTDEIEFLAYPNPAKDLLNIRFEDDGYFEISLFNVVGKLELYYQSFEQKSHILDVSNLPVGMYLLQISDGSDVKTKRVNVVR